MDGLRGRWPDEAAAAHSPDGARTGRARLAVRAWAVWQLPPMGRGYVVAVITCAVVAGSYLAAGTPVRGGDLGVFAVLLAAAMAAEVLRRLDKPAGLAKDWTVTAQHPDGALTVAHQGHGGRVTLPADYVAAHVELAYATTAHRAQGATVDTAHVLVTPEMTREALYVVATRARARTGLYVATSDLLDVDADHEPRPARTPHEVLTGVLNRESAEPSATDTIRQVLADGEQLPALVARYDYAHTTAVRASFPTLAQQALDPALARRVLADPAWPALADALGTAAAHGRDPAELLRGAAGERELDTAASATQVLHARATARSPAAPVSIPSERVDGSVMLRPAGPQCRSCVGVRSRWG